MQYFKSAAFLLLTVGSSVSLLSRAAHAATEQKKTGLLPIIIALGEKQTLPPNNAPNNDSLPTLETPAPESPAPEAPALETPVSPDPASPDPNSSELVPSAPTSLPRIDPSGAIQPVKPTEPAAVPTAQPNIGNLPDILFADPNPLTFPTTPEEIEIEVSPVVTLEQAVELAYRNNQALQAAELTLEQAAAALDEANAARLPTVSTSANLTNSQASSLNNTVLGGQIEVDYDLLTGGAREASIRAAELQQEISTLTVETQQAQVRFTTANAYYALQEAGEQIRINQSFVNEAERNLRDSTLRQEVGVGTRFDVLRAEVQFANARQSLIQSQGNQRIARRDIARLLNLPPTASVETTPVTVAANWPYTLEESIVLAFQNRAELEQQLLQADISEQQRQIALAAIRPRVNLFANYSAQQTLSGGSQFANDSQDSYSFGARFSMTLYDGGAARAQAQQREITGKISEEQFSENLDQFRFDVEQAYFNLQTNQENIATSQVAVGQAEEALSLANLRLQAGVGTQLEVLTAQSELTQAQVNNVSAILGYNRALAAIQRAVSNVDVAL